MDTHSLAVVLLSALMLAAASASCADSTSDLDIENETARSYWLRNREGWFWYQDPREAVKPNTKPLPPDTRAPELAQFEAMQKRLDELKKIAVMNPSEANMQAYMRYQRIVMDKSAVFADNWQRLLWKTPELDYSLTGRPTNAYAIDVYDTSLQVRQAEAVRAIARTHGLFFFFRSDCAYCHKFAPVLKRFEQDYGLTVFPVSLDGGDLADFPGALADNGMAATLNVSVVPALFLAVPGSREITPVGYGLMAPAELAERIYTITLAKRGQPF